MSKKLLHGRRLARSSGYRKALHRNLITDLLKYEQITTTEAKAKEVRGLVEQVITLGKKGGLPARRQALSVIFDEKMATKVFDELATRYAERAGGYTRIVKLGQRQGDGAPMVQLELVK
jgi:large subunit ribosomal protein L17